MGKFSTYRYLELKEDTSLPHISSRGRTIKQPRRLKKVFFLLIVTVLVVTYLLGVLAGQTTILDNIAKSLGYESVNHYAVIIDAGSSGSRVLAYKFRVPFTVFGPPNLDLVEEVFEQSKPGLSAYVDDPKKGADTIVQLIKKAEHLVPPEKRAETPLLVRATAGLRLLPGDKAQQLIDHVAEAISQLGYKTYSNSVQIMNSADEGIFIWYTVNLLSNLMGSETMAAIDLGGGSTQITYEMGNLNPDNYPAADQYVVPAGKNITLFTHSYLNLGLLAARHGIFKLESNRTDQTHFKSVCVEPIIQEEPWKYANKEYLVSGSERPHAMKKTEVFKRCRDVVDKYIAETSDWAAPAPPPGHVAAMSFFYDVAADVGLIDVMTGGPIAVSAYRGAALSACSASNVEQPWTCVDLVYLYSLLKQVYRIGDQQMLYLYKKIDGHEVSWALGLAYTTVMNRITTST